MVGALVATRVDSFLLPLIVWLLSSCRTVNARGRQPAPVPDLDGIRAPARGQQAEAPAPFGGRRRACARCGHRSAMSKARWPGRAGHRAGTFHRPYLPPLSARAIKLRAGQAIENRARSHELIEGDTREPGAHAFNRTSAPVGRTALRRQGFPHLRLVHRAIAQGLRRLRHISFGTVEPDGVRR